MSLYRKGKLRIREYQLHGVCDRLMDAISENAGVICECRLVNGGNLEITAHSYADYVLARSIAVEDFEFNAANIVYQRHEISPPASLEPGISVSSGSTLPLVQQSVPSCGLPQGGGHLAAGAAGGESVP